jgi:hypothetical protein
VRLSVEQNSEAAIDAFFGACLDYYEIVEPRGLISRIYRVSGHTIVTVTTSQFSNVRDSFRP